MLWTVDPSEVGVVMVITERMATVAKDVKVAIMTNLQPLMVLTSRTQLFIYEAGMGSAG